MPLPTQLIQRTFSSAYDVKGQLTGVTETDLTNAVLSAEAYTYDADGRQVTDDNAGTANVPHAVLSSTYDVAGRRTTLATTVNGSTDAATTYAYDNLDRTTSESQSGSGVDYKRVDFAYDNGGSPTSLTRYDTSGSSLLTTTYGYDAAGRQTLIENLLPTGTTSYSYSYDADDRRTLMQQTAAWGSYTASYAYDNAGQLTGATYPELAINAAYAYDPNGNRTSAADANIIGGTAPYTVGADNRVTGDGIYSYTFDHEGHRLMRTQGTTVDVYSWDDRGRLTGIVTSVGGTLARTISYGYDASDRRVSERILDGSGNETFSERYTFDGNDLVGVYDGSGNLYQRYLHGPQVDQVLAEETPANGSDAMRWLLGDDQGSIREMVDNGAAVTLGLVYDEYGNVIGGAGSGVYRFAFTGKQYDAAAELLHYARRYYDPADGDFISQDPSGLAPDADPYRYVHNDPVDLVDPTGLYATILGKYAAGLSGADVRGYSGFSDPLVNFGPGGGHSLIEEGPVLQRSEDLGFGGSSVSTVLQMGGSAYNGVSAELGLGSSSLSGGSGLLASSGAGMTSHEDQVMFEEANRQTRAQMGELVEPDTFATQGMGPRMGVASMGLAGIRSSPQPADADRVLAIASGFEKLHPEQPALHMGEGESHLPGLLQVIGGGVELLTGVAALPANPLLAVALIAHGFDNVQAGARSGSTGHPVQDFTAQGITAVTGSERLGALGDMAVGVGLTLGASAAASEAAAAERTAAELTALHSTDELRAFHAAAESVDAFSVGARSAAGFDPIASALAAEGRALPLGQGLSGEANITLTSRIGESSYAVRQAEGLSIAAQRDVDSILSQLSKGNPNPGIGTRALGNGYYELRGANGGRVIVNETGLNSYDIVGKFQGHVRGDAANSRVIQRLISEHQGG